MNPSSTQAALMTCMDRMHKIRFWQTPEGMTPGECKILNLICHLERENGCAAVSELSKVTGLKSASISRTMNALEEKGMITRSIDPKHRRNVLVCATESGRAADQKQQDAVCAYWDAVFARLPDADVSELLRIWNEVIDAMETVLEAQRSAPEEDAT